LTSFCSCSFASARAANSVLFSAIAERCSTKSINGKKNSDVPPATTTVARASRAIQRVIGLCTMRCSMGVGRTSELVASRARERKREKGFKNRGATSLLWRETRGEPWHTNKCSLLQGRKGAASAEAGSVAEQLFNTQKLVVLSDTVTSCRRTCFDLATIRCNSQIGNG